MICQEVMELMQRYIDGDLNQQETSLMMDHVGQCPDCAAMLVRLQRLSSELEQLPRVVPRYSLVDAILPELDRLASVQSNSVNTLETDTQPVPARIKSTRPGRNLFRKLSAVVAAGVVAGLLIVSQPQNWSFTGGSSNDEAAPAPMTAQMENATGFSAEAKMSDTAESSDVKKIIATEGAGNQAIEPEVPDTSGSDAPRSDAPRSEASAAPEEELSATDQYGKEIDKNNSASGSAEQEQDKAPATENIVTPTVDKGTTLFTTSGESSTPAEASVSPDEKWRAVSVANSGTIQVYKTADESEWYHSELREGQISLLSWNEDSTLLYYTHTDSEGKQTNYVLDVINVVESIR